MKTIRHAQQRYSYSIILLRQLVKTDFKLRYQGSVLGYVWSLLRPLLLFLILYFVFTVFLPLGKGVPHYPVYLLLGIVLWNFFGDVTTGSVDAVVGKGELIRKINFPKYNIIVAVAMAALINLFFNLVVVAIFMFFGHVGMSWNAIWILPLLLELFLVSAALAFLLSALYVRFRDLKYIWEVLMQAGFYATPIIYPLSRVGEHLSPGTAHRIREAMLLNPIAQVIQDARYLLVTPQTTTINQEYGGDRLIWGIPVLLTLVLLVLGAWYFRTHSRNFAEEV